MKARCINRWLAFGFLLPFLLGAGLFANNIQITGKPFMYNKNANEGSLYISFPVQWENSWKVNKPNNWDAAWVFVKYREGGNAWQPVYIDKESSKHSCVAYGDNNSQIETVLKVGTSTVRNATDTVEQGVGAFIYRAENGKGAVRFDSVNLKWNYKAQGLDNEAVISLRVFAIEMVYIPQEAYLMGNNTYTNKSISIHPDSGLVTTFYHDITTPGPNTWNVYGPAVGANIEFENTGKVAWPAGVSTDPKKPGNGTWYLTQSVNGVKAYAEIPKHAWSNLLYPFGQSWNGTVIWYSSSYHSWNAPSYGNRDGWHTIRLRMPVPYKATSMFFGWTQSYTATGFFGRASKDSVNWVDIAGSTATGVSYPAEISHRFSIPANARDSYQWYEFNIYTNTYLTLGSWGIADEKEGGDPANGWYYNAKGAYSGAVPLKYLVTGDKGAEAEADSAFPNGYEAFYIMKHELSQHAYVDFLNTLSEAQQEYLVYAGKPSGGAAGNPRCFAYSRNWIKMREKAAGSPAIYGCWVDDETQDPWSQEKNAGNVAMNGLDWYCASSYLCWAGLRPLTEMEYEKSCRGTAQRVEGEYAWGTASTIPITASPSNKNLANETANPANANYVPQTTGVVSYPMRVGSLATATSTRTDAGASFYGVLNLSDNVSEAYINISTSEGRKYSGEHGSGVLDGNGAAQIKNWPDVYSGLGTGIRGIYSNANPEVSNRNNAEKPMARTAGSSVVGVNHYMGCRGGRTAPR